MSRRSFNYAAQISPALLQCAAQILLSPACLSCVVLAAFPSGALAQETPDPSASLSPSAPAETRPRCQVNGTREITIACDYTPMPLDSAPAAGRPQVALNHATLSFETKDDNWMHLELRFTKLGSTPVSDALRVYIAIDDDSGHNFIRRPLPSVNFAGLAPGQSVEFKERLLFPALRPGHYQIRLWIPSVDPAFKFNAAHNLLVNSFGVADKKSGLNRIAAFSVTP